MAPAALRLRLRHVLPPLLLALLGCVGLDGTNPSSPPSSPAPREGVLTVEVLDVGQGDSILLRAPDGKVLLIDGSTGGEGVAIPPMLAQRGISRIDLLIATHPHADHIGGLDDVVASLPVGLFVDSGQAHTTRGYQALMEGVEARGVRYQTAEAGDRFNLGAEVRVELLHPAARLLTGTRSDLNSNSVVARVTHGDNCFLFTGDAEAPTEEALLRRGLGPCAVLKVAHHGGAHSSTAEFLDAVRPEIALISAGEGNSYGHPAAEAIARLEAAGAAVYRTDTMGTLRVVSDGQQLWVSAAREAPAARRGGGGGRININTASASELEGLPGIGPALSQAIVEHRQEGGPFASCDELEAVRGIGPVTVAGLRDVCAVR